MASMLTSRGWWFLLAALALLTVALVTGTPSLILTAAALLAWFGGQWFLFLLRLRWCQGRLGIRRVVRDERTVLPALWARQHAAVQVALLCDSPLTLPYVAALDHVPPLAEVQEGSPHAAGELGRGRPLQFTYRIGCPAPGRLLFLGLKLLLADLHGFFTASLFVRARRRYRVLPPLADARGRLRTTKRYNILPLLGTHRLRRAGSGNELLDLRDYMPGDPPKMIAWKASARRDRLMTKEYESEVPIRCTLFVDVSSSVRLGPIGRTPLARIVEIAAAVAQANAAARDLTGLCLADERKVHAWIRPARGRGHLARLMDRLADASALSPRGPTSPLDRFLPLAYGLAQDVYPDLLQEDVNAFPWWLPATAPRPASTAPRPPWIATSAWSKLTLALRLLFRNSPIVRALRLLFRDRSVVLSPQGGSRFSRRAHRLYRWRKKLAALLSVHYGLPPGGLARLLEDDYDCFHYVERFLAEHQVVCPWPMYDERGQYLFAAPGKWERLAKALLTAVTRGRDNELFVLLVDVLEGGTGLAQMQRAVRLARARHHSVMIVCPWPPSVEPPQRRRKGLASAPDPTKQAAWSTDDTLQDFLWRASAARLHQAFAQAQQMFAPLGVPVVCARHDDVPAMILHRMNLLRGLERGVR